MSADTVVALLVFLFPLAYSPGPGNTFFAAIGVARGSRAAVPALVGYHVATFLVTLLIGLGLGATLLQHPVLPTVLSAAGSPYVLWLAFGFLKTARDTTEPGTHPTPDGRPGIGFRAGAVVLLLNPKAYSIIAAMFSQALRPPENDDALPVLLVTLLFTANNLVAFLLWTFGGRTLTALFRSARSRRWIDRLFAGTLVGVAIWMALPLLD